MELEGVQDLIIEIESSDNEESEIEETVLEENFTKQLQSVRNRRSRVRRKFHEANALTVKESENSIFDYWQSSENEENPYYDYHKKEEVYEENTTEGDYNSAEIENENNKVVIQQIQEKQKAIVFQQQYNEEYASYEEQERMKIYKLMHWTLIMFLYDLEAAKF